MIALSLPAQVVGGRYAASHAKYLHDAKKTGAAAMKRSSCVLRWNTTPMSGFSSDVFICSVLVDCTVATNDKLTDMHVHMEIGDVTFQWYADLHTINKGLIGTHDS